MPLSKPMAAVFSPAKQREGATGVRLATFSMEPKVQRNVAVNLSQAGASVNGVADVTYCTKPRGSTYSDRNMPAHEKRMEEAELPCCQKE